MPERRPAHDELSAICRVTCRRAALKALGTKFLEAFSKSGPALDKAEKAMQAAEALREKHIDELNTAQNTVNGDKEKLLVLVTADKGQPQTVDKGQPQEVPKQQSASTPSPTDQKPPDTTTPDANKTAPAQEAQKPTTTPQTRRRLRRRARRRRIARSSLSCPSSRSLSRTSPRSSGPLRRAYQNRSRVISSA
jgi:hypothetical protein